MRKQVEVRAIFTETLIESSTGDGTAIVIELKPLAAGHPTIRLNIGHFLPLIAARATQSRTEEYESSDTSTISIHAYAFRPKGRPHSGDGGVVWPAEPQYTRIGPPGGIRIEVEKEGST